MFIIPVFLKYIKQIKGKLHPSLRIKRTKLHLINDAILMTTLNKLLLGGRKTHRKLSYRIIHARTSKILRKKILSIIESNFKKLERNIMLQISFHLSNQKELELFKL